MRETVRNTEKWEDNEGREKGRDVSKVLYQSLVSLMDHQSSPLNNRVRDALLTPEEHGRTRPNLKVLIKK